MGTAAWITQITSIKPGFWLGALLSLGVGAGQSPAVETINFARRITDAERAEFEARTLQDVGRPGRSSRIVQMRMPVYRPSMPLQDVAQRRAAYLGSVGIAFSVGRLAQGLLDNMPKNAMRLVISGMSPLDYATAVETEYRRFLYLSKAFPNEQVAPLENVDTFWHYHILDTMKYARDCEEVFGYFMHHYPYVGMAGENGNGEREQAGERMRELYESSFGISYVRAAGEAAPAVAVQTAWCVGPGIVKAADVRTAWCIGVPQAA